MCGLLAPLLVVADILYVVVFMRAGREDATAFDHFTGYAFFALWIIVPAVGILAAMRFLAYNNYEHGFWRAVAGGTLCLLFAAFMIYAYLLQ